MKTSPVIPSAADWGALESAISGRVVLPGSPDYDVLRRTPNARYDDVRPLAVVTCGAPDDVAETIALARLSGVQAVPRSGGHSFAGHSSTGGIIIDVRPMASVSISDGVATVGAGAALGDVYDSLDAHGLTIPAGCGPSVGIAGLTLGGGLGILGRRHGLTSDHLLRAEVVLADGRVVACDGDHDSDLFWALRGAGGGNFGVVTSLTYTTLPAPAATAFHLTWPVSCAAPVIDAWQAWAPAAPDELAASLLVIAGADIDRPASVHLFGTMLGTEADTWRLLEHAVARARADPASAHTRHMPLREAKRYLAEHAPGDAPGRDSSPGPMPRQGHGFSKSEFFRRRLPGEAIEALVENLTGRRVSGESRELDFSPWAGAYGRVRPEATAFFHRDARFLLKHEAVVPAEASTVEWRAARRWSARSWALVHPWGTGGVYPNFPDPDLADWARAYHGSNYDGLVRVKAMYDPEDFFRFPQAVSSRAGRLI